MPSNVIKMAEVISIEDSSKPKLYVFSWPSYLGGADTKLDHTLSLLCEFMDITCIPNHAKQLEQKDWIDSLSQRGIKAISREDFIALPDKLEGSALSFSNGSFVSGANLCRLAKSKGLKVYWGSEMMWHFPGELENIKQGNIDVVLYASKFNREKLEEEYIQTNPYIESYVVGNYIDPTKYPYKPRPRNRHLTIGRLSRADVAKYSVDLPVFYESLGLTNPKFRIMAWDQKVASMFKWHQFGEQWDLLEANKESALDFLYSLDLFVYKLGHTFLESWGRSTVEAMLTGCIPIVPTGHNFEEFIVQEQTGFMCETYEDYRDVCIHLERNPQLRDKISKQASAYAASIVCNRDKHMHIWRNVFNVR
jgi:hypothetical protein